LADEVEVTAREEILCDYRGSQRHDESISLLVTIAGETICGIA